MRKLTIPLLLLVVVFIAIASETDPPPPQNTKSVLWDPDNVLWDPQNSQLRDFSNVGYMSGNAPIPDWPVGIDVVADSGAIPGDGDSDVAAFRHAIENCPPYHAIRVPDGVYVIDDMIDVTRDNIVIRGESRDNTVIYFPKHLRELFPDWTGGFAELSFINFSGGENRGIENLSLVFRDEQKSTGYYFENKQTQNDRHWFFAGENPIKFDGGETDGWMRDIYIKNANHGIRIDGLGTKRITLRNIVLDQFAGRTMLQDATDGHMGIKLGSGVQHCLVHNILLTGRWDHDITPMGAKNNVFSRITGPNIELDHHAMGNSGNLFTQVDTGIGGRGYGEAINNSNETYWGIKGIKNASYLPTTSKSVMVGIRTPQLTDIGADYHHETIDPDALAPANIYLAQLEHFNKALPADQPLTLPPLPAGHPIRLHAADDAKVVGGTLEAINYGFEASLGLKEGGGTTLRQAFMKFDLGEAAPASVSSAILKIYASSGVLSSHPDYPLQVREVGDDSWSEATLTYTHANGLPVGNVIATKNIRSIGWYELDITAYVNSQLAGGDNLVSLKLSGANGGDSAITIGSAEGGNSTELVLHLDGTTLPPPAQPSGLTATPGDGVVSLVWSDNTEADFASYTVYRHAGDGKYLPEAMGLTTSGYEDIVVSNGTTYHYLVKAVDTAGTESLAGIGAVATPADPNNGAPTFVSDPIVGASTTVGSAYNGTIAAAATDPESDPMIFSLVSGPGWLSVAADGTLSGTTAAANVGLNSFVIRVDAAGGSDTATLEITVEASADTVPPAAPMNLNSVIEGDDVSLNWDANTEPDIATYNVYRSTTSGSYGEPLATLLTTAAYLDGSVMGNTTYYYTVTAVDLSGNESVLSSEVSVTLDGIVFGTVFTGNRTNTASNWSDGFPSATNLGSIGASGTIDNSTGYHVIQGNHVMNNAFGGTGFTGGEWTLNGGELSAQNFSLSGHLLTINGGTFRSTSSSGDIIIGNTSSTEVIMNGGVLSSLDSVFFRKGSTGSVTGGSVTAASLTLQESSALTVAGGNVNVSGGLGCGAFVSGAAGTLSFHGGITSANTLNSSTKPASPILFVMGGDTVGSLTASGFYGGTGNRSMNWLTGSLMTVTLSGANEWAEAEWNAGRLTYNGDSNAVFGSWAAVTAPDGLGAGTRFVYDSITETLSLVSPDITPPAIPVILEATGSNRTVSLSWTPSGDPDFQGYTVYRSTTSGSYGEALAAGLLNNAYIDSPVENGTTYYYVVTATDISGNESAPSGEVSVTPALVITTTFTGSQTNNPASWSNGLPVGTNFGGIGADGRLDSSTDFHVSQDGFVLNNPFGSSGLTGGEWILNGGTLSAEGLKTSGHQLTVNGGTVEAWANKDIFFGDSAASTVTVNGGTVSSLDMIVLKNSSTILISGGSVIASSFSIQDQTAFTISGGTVNVAGSLGSGLFYTGAAGTMTFNGGNVTAGTLASSTKGSSPVHFVFGGGPAGSLTVSGFSGSNGNRTMNWWPGSQMSVSVTGVANWAETEWNAGRLTYGGNGFSTFGTWAQVTAEDGLAPGVQFAYRAMTRTLHLGSGDTIAPAAPTGLTASAGIGSVSLDWADNGEADLATYTVYRSTTAGVVGVVVAANLDESDFTDTGVTDNTTYFYVVTAVDQSENESGPSAEGSARPGLATNYTTAEIPVTGTVSGSVSNVDASDDTYQTITEISDGTTSLLEHAWVFDVEPAEVVTFYVEAHRSANSEGDSFVFAYSTDDVNYIDMLTVTKTADDDSAQYFALPSGTAGTVYVRVRDTDRSGGNTEPDIILIDQLVIQSETSSAAPAVASEPSPADGAVGVSDTPVMSWKAGQGVVSHEVFFGTTPTPELQGAQSGTDFAPGLLFPNTTYFWSVSQTNSSGATSGPVWSFTTGSVSPRLSTGLINGVGDVWQTITLPFTYHSPVVVASVVYANKTLGPAVARVRNASGNSLELKVQNPSGLSLGGYDVHLLVIEEGVYTVAEHGVNLEAIKLVSTGTNENNNWGSSQQVQLQPANTYMSPVVLGQVMSANDGKWSVFWASSSNRANPATASSIFVGKHVGEDTDLSRSEETLGVILVESGSATLNGVAFTAAVGADSVGGIGDNAPYTYTFGGLPSATDVAVSSAGMDGLDGGWPVLLGGAPVSGTQMALAIDEDQLNDSERNHTSEQVSYMVFE